jgi:hypothetical protein
MRNLSPYFWLLIMALILSPITGIYYFGYHYHKKKYDKNFHTRRLNKKEKYVNTLKEDDAVYLFENKSYYELTNLEDFFGKESLFEEWLTKNKSFKIGSKEYRKWIKSIRARIKVRLENEKELKRLSRIRKEKAELRKRRVHDNLNSIKKPFIYIKKSLNKAFAFNTHGQIIKRAKQLTGILITIIVGVLTYYILNLMLYGINHIYNIWDTQAILETLLIMFYLFVFVGVIMLMGFGINKLDKYIVKEKGKGRHFYILEFISGSFRYIIYYPLYFTFKVFLWDLIAVGFFAGIGKSLFFGVINLTGIFGEYFNASYGEYCPGIEWID